MNEQKIVSVAKSINSLLGQLTDETQITLRYAIQLVGAREEENTFHTSASNSAGLMGEIEDCLLSNLHVVQKANERLYLLFGEEKTEQGDKE